MLFKEVLFLSILGLSIAQFNRFQPPGRFGFNRPQPFSVFNRPRPQPFRPQPPRFQPQPPPRFQPQPPRFQPQPQGPPPSQFQPGPAAPSRPSGGDNCNHEYRGGCYLLTWKVGDRDLSWNSARSYCARKGMRMISLDDPGKSQYFLDLLGRDGFDYFWAGGKINGDTLEWENGQREHINPGTGFWSPRSRSGRPQPEERNECLAILNNVYNDGVRWHDVSCGHKKPTICEA